MSAVGVEMTTTEMHTGIRGTALSAWVMMRRADPRSADKFSVVRGDTCRDHTSLDVENVLDSRTCSLRRERQRFDDASATS